MVHYRFFRKKKKKGKTFSELGFKYTLGESREKKITKTRGYCIEDYGK